MPCRDQVVLSFLSSRNLQRGRTCNVPCMHIRRIRRPRASLPGALGVARAALLRECPPPGSRPSPRIKYFRARTDGLRNRTEQRPNATAPILASSRSVNMGAPAQPLSLMEKGPAHCTTGSRARSVKQLEGGRTRAGDMQKRRAGMDRPTHPARHWSAPRPRPPPPDCPPRTAATGFSLRTIRLGPPSG